MLLFYHCSFCFGCADGAVWRCQGWVEFFVEGRALHASRRPGSALSPSAVPMVRSGVTTVGLGFFVEGFALHTSRTAALPDAADQSLEVFTLGEGE
jgi:hypothetical protein